MSPEEVEREFDETVDALDGARRKLRKQELFRAAAEAEVERLTARRNELSAMGRTGGAQAEVSSDGVVSE